MTLREIGAYFKARPFAVVLAGLLLIGVLYVSGGPAGALGALGLTALGLIALVYIGRQLGGAT